jgi:proteasome component ECM29
MADVEALQRVLTRLGLTEDDKLQGILEKLLPLVLGKLDNAPPPVQQQVLAILSHVNTRLQSLPTVALPVDALCTLYSTSTSPLVRNFALVYIERGAERSSSEERLRLVPSLLANLTSRPAPQQATLLRLAVAGMGHLSNKTMPFTAQESEEFAAKYPFLSNDADRQIFLDFILRLMLYTPASTRGSLSAVEASQYRQNYVPIPDSDAEEEEPQQEGGQGENSAAARAAAEAAPTPAPAPGGLSHADLIAIEGKNPEALYVPATLQARKLGVLNFTAMAGIAPAEVLAIYLAAASDPTDAVQKRGDELLKKRCAVDASRPPVNLENSETIEPLFKLFHGSLKDISIDTLAQRRYPAGPALRSRLLTLFCKSITAANSSPWAMMTVSSCLFGKRATPRIQQQGMEFAVWMFKHAEPAILAPAASSVVDNCLNLLDSSPAAAGQDSIAISLRSFAYQAIGQLAQRLPSALQGLTELASRCFSALATEAPGVRAAVAEATSSLAAAFQDRDTSTDEAILQLLETSIGNYGNTQQQYFPPDAVRGAAIQWATRLFPFSHLQARYLCILGTADTRVQLASAAEEGLDPKRVATAQQKRSMGGALTSIDSETTTGLNISTADYPSLPDMLRYLCSRHPILKSPVEEGRRLALPAAAFIAAVKFLENCRLHSVLNEEDNVDNADNVAAYLVFLENALVREAPGDLHAVALQAMLTVSATHRSAFTSAYASRSNLFERLLSHVDSGARDAAGRLLGTLASGMSPERILKLVEGMSGTATAAAEGKKTRFEEVDGATATLGYISAQLITGIPSNVPSTVLETVLNALKKLLESTHAESVLKATAAVALGCAGLPLGELDEKKDKDCVMPAMRALPDAVGLAASIAALTTDKDAKVIKKAAQALGFLAYGHRTSDILNPVVTSLLELRTSKVESVGFAVGEALCLAFGGVEATADLMLHTPFTSLSDLAEQQHQNKTNNGGKKSEIGHISDGVAAMDVEEDKMDGKNVDRAAEVVAEVVAVAEVVVAPVEARSSVESEIQRKIIDSLLTECVTHSRSEVRCSGAVWLVSLLLFCGKTAAVHAMLPSAQDALSSLLGDESELTQEMASRGLAAAYELADEATRASLVESLVGVLSGTAGRKRPRAGDLTDDTKVLEPRSIGTAPGGGSLSTYKEICSLANELGQPDLVYRFMQLANHQAAMNASRGAAFGFASVAKLAGDALAPHVATLVPRLYRSLYDPQPKVRDAMNHIWLALVDDPRATLTENFDAVAKALVVDMTGQQWRAREAAALAASDLIQGRRWEEIKPHFGDLWTAAFRTMDDIKESVRQAGLTLVRCIRGLTLRFADKELTPQKDGKDAVAAALPLLLQLGLPSRVPEVQALAVDTIAKIIKAAGPELVKPHLSVVVPALLESLSGLEDSRLNYVEQHAERLGVDAGKLESARVSAAQGGILGETLETCARHVDSETFTALAPALGGLIRRGTGLNTRAGAGRFVSQVARRLGDSSSAAAPQLMRALQEACAAERSPVVRRSYAAANALLAKHASQARVDKYVASWLEAYSADDADDSTRAVSGLLLRSLARESGDLFSRYAADVAPVSYMAQYDPDEQVAAIWADLWEESTTSVGAGLRLHSGTVLEKVQEGLKSSQWGRKKAAAAAAAKACEAGGDALVPYAPKLMDCLLAELPGRLWEGKETVLVALGAVVKACPVALKSSDAGVPSKVVNVLLEAVGKKKAAYRKEALIQLKEGTLLIYLFLQN